MNLKKIIFTSYILVILLLILLPINNKESSLNNNYIFKLRTDYIAHAFVFAPWMFLKPKKTFYIQNFWWCIIGLLFASSTEFLQYFLPYRAFNINDLIANSCGIILSYLFVFLFPKTQA